MSIRFHHVINLLSCELAMLS